MKKEGEKWKNKQGAERNWERELQQAETKKNNSRKQRGASSEENGKNGKSREKAERASWDRKNQK